MGGLRPLLSAELLSIGSELTVGETRDTNAGDLARSLSGIGIVVRRIQALPDDLDAVSGAFAEALERADLVVSTGGLGPTPDDLTREAIAAVVGETPAVDPDLESWLRGLWSRRGMTMPDMNLKQAWLIPSAEALPNANGTAPAWWVARPDGRLIVALPGPPREMRPIWREQVLPRLRERGAGGETAKRTFRLAGIGESAVAELLGEELLRAGNPIVATYARADAVDVRISPGPTGAATGSHGSDRVRRRRSSTRPRRGSRNCSASTSGPRATRPGPTRSRRELERLGWTLACVEVGTGGSLASLLGDRAWLQARGDARADAPAATRHADPDDPRATPAPGPTDGLEALARQAREVGGSDVGDGSPGPVAG